MSNLKFNFLNPNWSVQLGVNVLVSWVAVAIKINLGIETLVTTKLESNSI
jgi:hypothetical protein